MPTQARDTSKTPLTQLWIPPREASCGFGKTVYFFQTTATKKGSSLIFQTGYTEKPLAHISEARKGGRGLQNGPWVGFSACPLQHTMSWKHLALMQIHSEGKYLLCRLLAGGAEILATGCQISALTKGEERLHYSFYHRRSSIMYFQDIPMQ